VFHEELVREQQGQDAPQGMRSQELSAITRQAEAVACHWMGR